MNQQDLFCHFDGATYEPEHDQARLTGQLLRVYNVMSDNRWRTLHDLSVLAKGTEASVSARLRDLRKPRFGGFEVERKRKKGGLFLYRVVP
jgi:hypothetical protein